MKTRPAALRMKAKDIDELIECMGTMEIEDIDTAPAAPAQPFRFFDLPYELRLRVYELLLVFPKTLDLDPANGRAIVPFLRLFFVSRRIHDEASRVFYSRNTFRVFPIHGRFINHKAPLLARLPPLYRSYMTKFELRLGPGWTKPPKGWVTDARLKLEDAAKVHMLKVFVECDPASHPIFEGFRLGDDYYTHFSVGLLRGLFAQLPSLSKVEFDAYPSVPKSSPLLQGLVDEVKAGNKRILWGPESGWDKIVDVDLVNVLQKMGLEAP